MTQIVYLDLNKIIDLAKDKKADNLALLDRLLQLVKDKKAIFPCSLIHFMEISAINDTKRILDIVNVINLLSNGILLQDIVNVMYFEVYNALSKHFNKLEKIKSRKDISFTKISNYLETHLQKEFKSEELIEKMALNYIPKINSNSHEFICFKDEIEKNIASIKTQGKSIIQIENECVLSQSSKFIELIKKASIELSLTDDDIKNKPLDLMFNKEFLLTIPTIRVFSKLHLLFWTNENIIPKPNHIYDFAHLSVAIPYCNIIVTDKEMSHVIKRFKINNTYESLIFTSLESALEHIEKIEN